MIDVKVGRVFCVGAHRTGTRSLGHALRALGLATSHWAEHNEIMQDLIEGRFRLQIMERFDAVADLPIPSIYRQLDEEFPGSRFILTIRDPASWLVSATEHTKNRDLTIEEYLFYGAWRFEPDRAMSRYLQHNSEVMRYFKNRGDMLVLDVSAPSAWNELSEFLGCSAPTEIPFPHWPPQARRSSAQCRGRNE